MQINEHRVADLEEYSSYVFRLASATEDAIWFRGQSRFSYSLSPSIIRKSGLTTTSMMAEEEDFFIHKFDQRGRPYISERNLSVFEKLFIMQHFGLPTRLLDWSENPYVGLYFAISGNDEHDGAVYTLKPGFWNEASLSSRTAGIRTVLNTDNEFVDHLKPSRIRSGHQHTVSIFATHNTTRIIAQRGVFTLFGGSLDSMDMQFVGFSAISEPDVLTKICIPAESKGHLREQLFKTGITESVVFPDLEHLALESKRQRSYP